AWPRAESFRGCVVASTFARNAANLFRLRDDSKIWLGRFPALRITPLRLLVGNRAGDDNVLSWQPVDRRSHLMLRGQLKRIDHSQHFIEISASCHWVDKYELDFLVWSDDVNITHSRVIGRFARFRVALGIRGQHPIEFCHVEIGIPDDRVIWRVTLSLLNVLRPSFVFARRINRQSDDLYIPPVELWLYFRPVTELG